MTKTLEETKIQQIDINEIVVNERMRAERDIQPLKDSIENLGGLIHPITIDKEKNLILVQGSVPGPNKGLVLLKTTTKAVKKIEPLKLSTGKVKESAVIAEAAHHTEGAAAEVAKGE